MSDILLPKELLQELKDNPPKEYKNPSYLFGCEGSHWYNNGTRSMYFVGEQPSGWVRGRLKKSVPDNTDTVMYNNGEYELRLNKDDEVPNGFVQGRLNLNRDSLGRYIKKDSNPTL